MDEQGPTGQHVEPAAADGQGHTMPRDEHTDVPLPFGVYVHVPYCRRRCSYCDFYFEIGRGQPEFAEAIAKEMRGRVHEIRDPHRSADPAHAQSLYFGGGTPTALAPSEIRRVIESVGHFATLAADAEITVEANPEDLTPGVVRELAAAGVNRLSIGVQSFDARVLRYLGRAHTGAQAREAVLRAQDEGIGRISLDLICGVPTEEEARLAEDLERVNELNIGHVSAYLLTVEEHTPLEKLIALGRRDDVDDERQADAYEELQRRLPELGLLQYEVSSYARPAEESRHNRLYWAKGTYWGLGPGAHSLRDVGGGSVARRHTQARLDAWLLDPVGCAHETEVLAPFPAFLEAVAFGLRDLQAGVALQKLARRFCIEAYDDVLHALARGVADGHLSQADGVYRLTRTGVRFADAVARQVLGITRSATH